MHLYSYVFPSIFKTKDLSLMLIYYKSTISFLVGTNLPISIIDNRPLLYSIHGYTHTYALVGLLNSKKSS